MTAKASERAVLEHAGTSSAENSSTGPLTVLIMSYYFPPSPDVGGLRAHSFARDLARLGFGVHVLAGPKLSDLNEALLGELPTGVHVHREKRWFSGASVGLGAALGAFRAARRLARRVQLDAIVATGPPWGTIKAGWLLSRHTGIPLISDVRDPWTRGELWAVHRRSILSGLGERCWEKVIYRSSMLVLSVHDRAAEELARRHRDIPRHRFETVENGFDECEAPPQRPPESASRCLFSHIGKLHATIRPAAPLLEGFALACRHASFAREARLLQIGPPGDIQASARQLRLGDTLLVHEEVSLGHARSLMRGSDVLVLLNTWTSQGRYFPTAKIYEYLAARRPMLVLAQDNNLSARMARKTQSTLCPDYRCNRDVASGFLRMWRRWRAGRLHAHQLDLSTMTRESQSRRLATLLQQRLTAGSSGTSRRVQK